MCASEAHAEAVLQRLRFFQNAQRSLGVTALCLSGGGSLAMNHLGVVRALMSAKVLPQVVTGSSGGSIVAAMIGCKTDAELRREVLVPEVSTDYGRTGLQRQLGVRWFPPVLQQALHFVRKGVLMDNREFRRCTRFYYGEMTFAEAFLRTGRKTCITVSAASLGTRNRGPQRLLLNHISTPHVLVASAVQASCSLPGIMHPLPLEAKDHNGRIQAFEPDGVQWMDGSLQADLPTHQIAQLFNAQNVVASQVNPHVVPFLRTERPLSNSVGWQYSIVSFLTNDLRHRVKMLSKFGLLPPLLGRGAAVVNQMLRQRFSGNVTIVPEGTGELSLRAVSNPTAADMRRYLLQGARATWPHVQRIRDGMLWERRITAALKKLRRQAVAVNAFGRHRGVSLRSEDDVCVGDSRNDHRSSLRQSLMQSVPDDKNMLPFVLEPKGQTKIGIMRTTLNACAVCSGLQSSVPAILSQQPEKAFGRHPRPQAVSPIDFGTSAPHPLVAPSRPVAQQPAGWRAEPTPRAEMLLDKLAQVGEEQQRLLRLLQTEWVSSTSRRTSNVAQSSPNQASSRWRKTPYQGPTNPPLSAWFSASTQTVGEIAEERLFY